MGHIIGGSLNFIKVNMSIVLTVFQLQSSRFSEYAVYFPISNHIQEHWRPLRRKLHSVTSNAIKGLFYVVVTSIYTLLPSFNFIYNSLWCKKKRKHIPTAENLRSPCKNRKGENNAACVFYIFIIHRNHWESFKYSWKANNSLRKTDWQIRLKLW